MKNYQLLSEKVIHTDSGEFFWIDSPNAAVKAGSRAGFTRDGYRLISLNKYHHRASVLAFFMHHGRLPIGFVDHINGDTLDNRTCNLRECTAGENNQNLKCLSNNKNKSSRFVGVYWHTKRRKWRAAIKYNRKKMTVGEFDTEEEAFFAYLEAKKKYHTFNPVPRDVEDAYRSINGV